MSYLIIDIETGIKEAFGRKAHFLKNNIVAIGLKNQQEGKIKYLGNEKLTDLKIDEDILVGHNLKFDLLYLWGFQGFQDFLKRGGIVYDTMLAEYFITAQQHKFPGLREIAVLKYGCAKREKLMEKYWEQGVDTIDIPTNLVLADLEADVFDTESIYLGQLNILTDQQKRLLKVQNNLLLSTIEMEYNGFMINRELLEQNQLELEAQLSVATNRLEELTKPYNIKDFNYGSNDQLSLLLFGGEMKQIVKEPVLNPDGSYYTFKSGKREGEIKLQNVTKLDKIKGLNIKPKKAWETKKKGIYATNESVLQEILKELQVDYNEVPWNE